MEKEAIGKGVQEKEKGPREINGGRSERGGPLRLIPLPRDVDGPVGGKELLLVGCSGNNHFVAGPACHPTLLGTPLHLFFSLFWLAGCRKNYSATSSRLSTLRPACSKFPECSFSRPVYAHSRVKPTHTNAHHRQVPETGPTRKDCRGNF